MYLSCPFYARRLPCVPNGIHLAQLLCNARVKAAIPVCHFLSGVFKKGPDHPYKLKEIPTPYRQDALVVWTEPTAFVPSIGIHRVWSSAHVDFSTWSRWVMHSVPLFAYHVLAIITASEYGWGNVFSQSCFSACQPVCVSACQCVCVCVCLCLCVRLVKGLTMCPLIQLPACSGGQIHDVFMRVCKSGP